MRKSAKYCLVAVGILVVPFLLFYLFLLMGLKLIADTEALKR